MLPSTTDLLKKAYKILEDADKAYYNYGTESREVDVRRALAYIELAREIRERR